MCCITTWPFDSSCAARATVDCTVRRQTRVPYSGAAAITSTSNWISAAVIRTLLSTRVRVACRPPQGNPSSAQPWRTPLHVLAPPSRVSARRLHANIFACNQLVTKRFRRHCHQYSLVWPLLHKLWHTLNVVHPVINSVPVPPPSWRTIPSSYTTMHQAVCEHVNVYADVCMTFHELT